jgi:chromosome partitioning protein
MRKIVVALSKGGVGKTTTAINLAAGLSRAGNRVLLVDMDTQGQVAKSLGLQPQVGLAEVMTGELSPEAAVMGARGGLWLLAGGRSLAGLKRDLARKDFGGERGLAEALEPLNGRYDQVIVDTAPAWDVLMVNALFYAHEVLIPVSLEVMALQGLVDFTQALDPIRKYHQALALRYVLPTFMDRRVKKSEEILGQLQRHYGDLVCDPIRYNVRLSEAPGHGQTIYEYSPTCAGSQDYMKLTERVMQDGQS